MEKTKRFLCISVGIIWEWLIIPLFFYLIFRNKKNFEYLFPSNKIVCFLVFILYFSSGLILTISSFYCLHIKGKGTILPQIPTKNLVKDGVYSYCRNPMYLGYSFLYFAFSFLFKNIWFSFISISVFLFIFLYAKFFEEKKLFERFGEDYLDYKGKIPFIIPFNVLLKYKKNRTYLFFLFSLILLIFLFIFNLYLLKNITCFFCP